MHERDPRFEGTKREHARALYESGLSERAVAAQLGLSRTRTRALLAESGTKRRRRGRPRQRETIGRKHGS